MSRRSTIALLGVLAAVACENMGLDYAGPAGEAEVRPASALVTAVFPPTAEPGGRDLVVGGRLWVPAGRPLALEEENVRPVGSANGRTVYARSWDRPPYDFLFTRAAEEAAGERDEAGEADAAGEGRGWVAYRPVIGGGGPRPADDARRTGTGAAGGH